MGWVATYVNPGTCAPSSLSAIVNLKVIFSTLDDDEESHENLVVNENINSIQ